jgi:hypothetical protein
LPFLHYAVSGAEYGVHERIKDCINKSWRPPKSGFLDHIYIFDADFSVTKMMFATIKGQITFLLRKRLGKCRYVLQEQLEAVTDFLFKLTR